MDYTIEVWTLVGIHYAQCTCEWEHHSAMQSVLERTVREHMTEHRSKGDKVEVV